jgi:DnaJ-class molecular chaperone
VTHYEVLGVAPRASLAVIKAAHRALARKYHPDLGGDAAKCAAVNVAWDVLSNAKTRRVYDLTLAAAQRPPCARCEGTGSVTLQKGFKAKLAKVCPTCLGSGLL